MYKLTKQNIRYGYGNTTAPVLIGDGGSGPWDRNSILPQTAGSTASGFVWRHLLDEPLRSDPGLEVDPGADKVAFCWEYLMERTPREVLEFAEMFHRMKIKGIKLPSLI